MEAVIKIPVIIFTFVILAATTGVILGFALAVTVFVAIFVILFSPFAVFASKSSDRESWFRAPGATFTSLSSAISKMWLNWQDALF